MAGSARQTNRWPDGSWVTRSTPSHQRVIRLGPAGLVHQIDGWTSAMAAGAGAGAAPPPPFTGHDRRLSEAGNPASINPASSPYTVRRALHAQSIF